MKPTMSGEDESGASGLDWTQGAPRSARFGDTYFSAEDGLEETRAVFLAGCGLPQRWAGAAHFTVAELGFGTGLNILALAQLWRETRPSSRAVLRVFSIEGFPIGREDAARALARWPELSDLAAPLLANWPMRRGRHRIEWPGLGLILDLDVGEVRAALEGWRGRADVWFLDGFAPAVNPEMWTPEVLHLVAARSAPGARAASFTVAGGVRRGLAEAGFRVDRAPGFGRKKQRMEAQLPGIGAADASPPRIAVIGGGIAGAALVHAFVELGASPTLIEVERPGAGASGNPAALVTPWLDAGLGAAAQLHAEAFRRATALYRRVAPEGIVAEGALQLEVGPRDTDRFAAIAAWNGFPASAVARETAAAALGEAHAPGALSLPTALTLEPAPILAALMAGAEMRHAHAAALRREGQVWQVLGADGGAIAEADIVCVAAGAHTARLIEAPLRAVRGQASFTAEAVFTGEAAAWGGYAIPLPGGGVLFGATHGRDDWDTAVRAEDEARNRETLAEQRPALSAALAGVPLQNRAATRAATRDHLPLVGRAPGMEGVFVLAGLGGRGFTLAPLLAESVAAEAMSRPDPLSETLRRLVDPARFAGR